MTLLEMLAASLGIVSVWLTVRQNPWCWPVGLVMVILYGWFFHTAKLHSQVLLHGVFALLQVYGWWQWTRGGLPQQPRKVSLATAGEVFAGIAAASLVGALLGASMAGVTDAVHPWPDALLTAFSLLAQLWMALKRAQCWLLWIIVDVLFVILFGYQGYLLTAALYGLFTLLAVVGWREWRAELVPAR